MFEVLERIIKKCFSVVGIKLSEETITSLVQFVKFGIVGVSNTLISYVVYTVFVVAGAEYLIGNVFGFIISVLNSFYWNNKYVFKTEDGENRTWIYALLKTFIAYAGTGLVLSSVLLVLWIDILHIHKLIAPIINLCVTIPLNFIINKFWAFKTRKD